MLRVFSFSRFIGPCIVMANILMMATEVSATSGRPQHITFKGNPSLFKRFTLWSCQEARTDQTCGTLLQTTKDYQIKTKPIKAMNQKNLKQTGKGTPPQSNHEEVEPGCRCDPTTLEQHHQQNMTTHCEKKKQPKDEKIGFIVTCFGTKDNSSGYRTGLVGAPLALPPRLPCVPRGQIVAHKRPPPGWPQRKHLYEENASYTGCDHDEQERPFKRIRPHEQVPSLHMVSP